MALSWAGRVLGQVFGEAFGAFLPFFVIFGAFSGIKSACRPINTGARIRAQEDINYIANNDGSLSLGTTLHQLKHRQRQCLEIINLLGQ